MNVGRWLTTSCYQDLSRFKNKMEPPFCAACNQNYDEDTDHVETCGEKSMNDVQCPYCNDTVMAMFMGNHYSNCKPKLLKDYQQFTEQEGISIVTEEQNNDVCCVCLLEFDLKETMSYLVCSHAYHPECIKQWMVKSKECPKCRREI